jgi:hypothetical protein
MIEGEYVGEVDVPGRGSKMPDEFKDKPHIRVYLASALTERDSAKEFDDEVRTAICDVFSKASVQSDGYVIKYDVYNPAEHTAPGSYHRCEEVFHIDFKELVRSDFAMFYLNDGSLGVGMERLIAAIGGVPAGWICQKEKKVSRMFQGVFGGSLFHVEFEVVEELKGKLADEVAKFGPEIIDKARRRRQAIQTMQASEIPRKIFKRVVVLDMNTEELAKETGIQPFWWQSVMRDPSGLLAAATFTPILFFRNAEALAAGWEISEIGAPTFRADNKLGQAEEFSLDNLYDAYVCRDRRVEDELLLGLWREHVERTKVSAEPLLESGEVVSKEEWLTRIQEREKSRFLEMLGVDPGKVSKVEKESLDNLYNFAISGAHPISDVSSRKLWHHVNKHTRERKAAAREGDGQRQPYSVEDWRKVFNQLHLDD